VRTRGHRSREVRTAQSPKRRTLQRVLDAIALYGVSKMAQSFGSSALTDKKALLDLAEKPEKNAAEEAILRLVEKREEYVRLAELIGLPQEVVAAIATQPMREAAMR